MRHCFHQMRQVFHQVYHYLHLVVFTHDSGLRLKI